MSSKRLIFDFNKQELKKILDQLKLPSYTIKQLFKWIYNKIELNIDNYTDISKNNREVLKKYFDFSLLPIIKKQTDPYDGTIKYLLRVHENQQIETVLIKERNHYTQCLSTQIGCSLGCKFCITGTLGFHGNLTVGEIVSQVLTVAADSGIKPRNLVFMGMGEPLLNTENVIKAIEIFTDREGLDFGFRKITVSTVGILNNLKKLLNKFPKIGIAISLNHVPEKRAQIMPVENIYPIKNVIEFYKKYSYKYKRPTFEYVLLKDINSSPLYAKKIRELLAPIPCKINLIPYNENEIFNLKSVNEEELNAFIKELYKGPNSVTVRRSKGKNIKAACGQLSGEKNAK